MRRNAKQVRSTGNTSLAHTVPWFHSNVVVCSEASEEEADCEDDGDVSGEEVESEESEAGLEEEGSSEEGGTVTEQDEDEEDEK